MLPHESDFATPPTSLVDDARVKAALTEYRRLIDARDSEYGTLRELEDERNRAVEADRQALADAFRANKPDPGQEATRQADEAILACRRRADALDTATADAGRELVAVVEARRVAWASKLDGHTVEARGELGAAVAALEAARERLAEALALRAWLDGFPGRARWPVGFLGHVPAIPGRNGDPVTFDAVLAGLRQLAEPPTRKAEPEAAQRPPLAPVV